MRQRPWALVMLAALHFMAPIGNVIFNALITGRDVLHYLVLAMSPVYLSMNWVIIVAPLVAGAAIYACKRWSFYVYLLSITTLFVFSYAGYQSKVDSISLIPVIFVYLINIAVVSYVLIPAVRNIYFDRRLRWWEIQARYKCDFKCQWQVVDRMNSYNGRVENLSENGLFIKSDELPEDNAMIKINLPFSLDTEMSFVGATILHNRVDAVGFGVKFEHTKESKKSAKKLIADLEARGMRISTRDGRPEDSFSYWIRTLVTTGKGLLPSRENKSKS